MPARRPLPIVAALGGLLIVAGGVLAAAGPASAASVDGADPIWKVQVTPDNPTIGDQLTTSIDWCAPAGAKPGDTFTLTLDPKLKNLPSGFELDDPKTGAPVATGKIATGTPSVVTFTLTTYLDTHHDTCGVANVASDFSNDQVTLGQPNPFTFTTGDGKTFTTEVTPTGNVQGDEAYPAKYGQWLATDADGSLDEGRSQSQDVIDWYVTTPQGPFTSATTDDALPAGQTWDCSHVVLQDGRLDAAGDYVVGSDLTATAITDGTAPAGKLSYTCSSTALVVHWPAQIVGRIFRVGAAASITKPTGPSGAAEFDNSVDVATYDGTTQLGTWSVQAFMQQASAAGHGAGVANAAVTAPTSTPSAPATAAPAPVAPAAATGGATTAPSAELAYTGSAPIPAIVGGALMVLFGGALVGAGRIRSRPEARR